MEEANVSVVMACFNEEEFIKKAIASLMDNYFEENCELIVVDGMSTDGTCEIVELFKKEGLRVKLLENKKRIQSYGLNLGIKEAKGDIIVRADAHCVYPAGYIKKCVQLLGKNDAANVGGMMLPQGKTTIQKAIALAMQHPVGVGDARFHLGNFKGYVDTVYLGTFRKDFFEKIGPYDINAHPNEDAEFNIRVQKAGRKIYLDSSIRVKYFSRASLKNLAQQYFKYGRGRCYTTLKHKKITSFRQIAPVLLVAGLVLSFVLSFWNLRFLLFPAAYVIGILIVVLFSWRKQPVPLKQRFLVGISFLLMHVMWGIGFISYLIKRARNSEDD